MDETTTTVYSGSASGLVSQSVYRISYWDLSLPFSCIGIVQNVAPGCLMMAAYGMGSRPVPPLHSTRTSVNRTSNMDSMDCIGGWLHRRLVAVAPMNQAEPGPNLAPRPVKNTIKVAGEDLEWFRWHEGILADQDILMLAGRAPGALRY